MYCQGYNNLRSELHSLISKTSPHVRESGIRNPTFFSLWNPESWALESGIQSLESGIQLVESGIQPHPQLWNLCLECTTLLVVIT